MSVENNPKMKTIIQRAERQSFLDLLDLMRKKDECGYLMFKDTVEQKEFLKKPYLMKLWDNYIRFSWDKFNEDNKDAKLDLQYMVRVDVDFAMAYLDYLDGVDVDKILDDALQQYPAVKKSFEIISMTAENLIADLLLDEPIKLLFSHGEDDGLCCTILSSREYLRPKSFPFSLETFREDFIKAYENFKLINSHRCDK